MTLINHFPFNNNFIQLSICYLKNKKLFKIYIFNPLLVSQTVVTFTFWKKYVIVMFIVITNNRPYLITIKVRESTSSWKYETVEQYSWKY